MPPPRHRAPRRPRWQFLLLMLALAGVIVGVAVAKSGNGGQPTGTGATSPSPTRNGGVHSPRTTPPRTTISSTPSPSPTPPRRGTLLIHGAGDTNVDPSYIPNLRQFGYSYALSGLRGLFLHDDLTVVNLECAVSNLGSAVPKEFNFRGDPRALPFLKAGGVEVANMGNNHSYDYGPDALVDTRRNIAKAGLAPVGAGKDPAEAEKPAIFHRKGWTIAVVGIDEVLDPEPAEQAQPGHPGTACGHDVDCMVREIRLAA